MVCHVFFFNDTATTEIYTLSLHDALPIYILREAAGGEHHAAAGADLGYTIFSLHQSALDRTILPDQGLHRRRSEEHTSELQSRPYLVCRLLVLKKIQLKIIHT